MILKLKHTQVLSSDFASIEPRSKSKVGRIEFVPTFDCHTLGLLWISIKTMARFVYLLNQFNQFLCLTVKNTKILSRPIIYTLRTPTKTKISLLALNDNYDLYIFFKKDTIIIINRIRTEKVCLDLK